MLKYTVSFKEMPSLLNTIILEKLILGLYYYSGE